MRDRASLLTGPTLASHPFKVFAATRWISAVERLGYVPARESGQGASAHNVSDAHVGQTFPWEVQGESGACCVPSDPLLSTGVPAIAE